MSRVGKLPVELNKGTQARIENGFIIIKGARGELRERMHRLVNIEIGNDTIKVSVRNQENKKEKSLWGLYRNLIKNMVVGVNEGYKKKLEINGIGFKASVSGSRLILDVGYAHSVEYVLPDGITAQVEENIITIRGIDKKLVGEAAAQIRKIKKPEPYKGKGIKYIDEVIARKVGKTAAKNE